MFHEVIRIWCSSRSVPVKYGDTVRRWVWLWVSSVASYLMDVKIAVFAALAKLSLPASEKCRPSRPKCDQNRCSRDIACIRSDLEHMCLMKTLIFSILLFKDVSSNLIGISLRTILADLFNFSTRVTRLPIFLMHVPTSSFGTLLVPPRTTITSSLLEIAPGSLF